MHTHITKHTIVKALSVGILLGAFCITVFSCGEYNKVMDKNTSNSSGSTTTNVPVTGYVGTNSSTSLELAATPASLEVYKYVAGSSQAVDISKVSGLVLNKDGTQISGHIAGDTSSDVSYKVVIIMSDGSKQSAVLPGTLGVKSSQLQKGYGVAFNQASDVASKIVDNVMENHPGTVPDVVSALKLAQSAVNGGVTDTKTISLLADSLATAQKSQADSAKSSNLNWESTVINSAALSFDPSTIKSELDNDGSASNFNWAGPVNIGFTNMQSVSGSSSFNPQDIAQNAILATGNSTLMKGFSVTQVDIQMHGCLSNLSASQASLLRTHLVATIMSSSASSLNSIVSDHPMDPHNPLSSIINNGIAASLSNIDPNIQEKILSDESVIDFMDAVRPSSVLDEELAKLPGIIAKLVVKYEIAKANALIVTNGIRAVLEGQVRSIVGTEISSVPKFNPASAIGSISSEMTAVTKELQKNAAYAKAYSQATAAGVSNGGGTVGSLISNAPKASSSSLPPIVSCPAGSIPFPASTGKISCQTINTLAEAGQTPGIKPIGSAPVVNPSAPESSSSSTSVASSTKASTSTSTATTSSVASNTSTFSGTATKTSTATAVTTATASGTGTHTSTGTYTGTYTATSTQTSTSTFSKTITSTATQTSTSTGTK